MTEQQLLALFPRAYEPLPPQPTDELTIDDCIQILRELEIEQMARIDALQAQIFEAIA